jgi:hypothetical protein
MANSVSGHLAGHDESTEFLDRKLPLVGASHADVVNYSVDVPLSFASCFATLNDGRKVRFRDSGKFLGWSDAGRKRTLLFRSGRRRIEIHTNTSLPAGHIRSGRRCRVVSWPSLMLGGNDLLIRRDRDQLKSREQGARKFIARDGGLLIIGRLGQLLATSIGRPLTNTVSIPGDHNGFAGRAPV